MEVQVTTDSHIPGSADLKKTVSDTVSSKLKKFSSSITTVVVHFTDQSSGKGGGDGKHCAMEIRMEGLQPVAVKHDASTVKDALHGAISKGERVVKDSVEKRRNH